VLDASAVMALLHDEAGSSAVVEAIAAGTTICVVNYRNRTGVNGFGAGRRYRPIFGLFKRFYAPVGQ